MTKVVEVDRRRDRTRDSGHSKEKEDNGGKGGISKPWNRRQRKKENKKGVGRVLLFLLEGEG